MLYEVLKHIGVLRYSAGDGLVKEVRHGCFEIEDGCIILDGVTDGMVIVIDGSDLNDGAYVMPCGSLNDEVFNGTVYVLRNKPAFMALVSDIEQWQAKNSMPTAYASESFGGYSYSRAATASGSAAGWQQAYGERLRAWRKV